MIHAIRNPYKAVAYLLGAHLFFTLLDSAGKALAADMGVPLIALIRHFGQVLLMVLVLGPTMRAQLIKTEHRGLQLARGLALSGFSLFFFTALRLLPQAEATAINFITPFAVMLLVGPLLGETVTWRRWAGAGLGFVGMLAIIRPGSGLEPLGVLFVLLTVLCNIVFQILTRKLSTLESTNSTVFITAVIGMIVSILALPLQEVWGGWPSEISTLQIFLFISLGITGTISQWCLIRAYYWSNASFIAPLIFLQLIFAAGFGALFFQQFPGAVSLVGMALILLSGVGTVVAESWANRTKNA